MSKDITLTLPDPVYQQAQEVADSTRRDIQDVLTEVITENFRPFPVNANREAMLQEVEAFKGLHSTLAKKYFGDYVAILNGELIDHDIDPVALHKRVNDEYPGQTVLQRKVEKEADTVLQFRSPRIISKS